MNGPDRSRVPPGEIPPQRDPRRGAESRNGGHAGSGDGASRAERFEDEKRRIVQSSFAKKDSDGACMSTANPQLFPIELSAWLKLPFPTEPFFNWTGSQQGQCPAVVV